MSLNLRKAIIRNISVTSGCFFGIAGVFTWLMRGFSFSFNNAMWVAFFALLAGLLRGWQKSSKVKKDILLAIPHEYSLQQVERNNCSSLHFNHEEIDWPEMDRCAADLLNLGYSHVGDFVAYPPQKRQISVGAFYLNRSNSILVEIQYVAHANNMRPQDTRPGLHFLLSSLVGGHIHVTTTDHHPNALNALLRGEHDVGACYPKLELLALLEKHQRILGSVQKRTHKKVTRGLSIERSILLMRERLGWAQQRLMGLDGFAIAQEVDSFDLAPQYKWTPPSLVLAAAANRDWREIDQSIYAQIGNLIIEDGPAAPKEAVSAEQAAFELALDEEVAHEAQRAMALPSVLNAANYLFGLALLSLLNCVLNTLESPLIFTTGLYLVREAERLVSLATLSPEAQWFWHGVSYFAMLSLLALAWMARRPWKKAFVVAIVLLTLDAGLIFLHFSWLDCLGLVIHGVVIYKLWCGWQLCKELEELDQVTAISELPTQTGVEALE